MYSRQKIKFYLDYCRKHKRWKISYDECENFPKNRCKRNTEGAKNLIRISKECSSKLFFQLDCCHTSVRRNRAKEMKTKDNKLEKAEQNKFLEEWRDLGPDQIRFYPLMSINRNMTISLLVIWKSVYMDYIRG